MHLISAFISLVLVIHQTHSNTYIAYAFYLGNETDRAALLVFKSKMIDDPQGIVSSWNESLSHCNWLGVSCSRRHAGRVTALNLNNQKLIGTIPPDIGNLTFLRRVHLEANRLRGNIPEEFGRLFRLKTLGLLKNELGGEIPRNLSSCVGMQFLFLQYNQLSGRIPDELRYLAERELVVFGVSVKNLTGRIPSWLGNGSSLIELYMGHNEQRGRIPADVGSISKLKTLNLHYNNLTGCIPSSVYNLISLVYFEVGGQESIFRQVPQSLPNATGLEDLFLTSNSFTGNVPANLGNLRNHTMISFSKNQFQTGFDSLNFLTEFTNCTKLKVLDFGHKKLKAKYLLTLLI
ncbi:hypothetical protein EUGRSUZ_I00657 [Eucalyptus grandis]|uniref:Uncharacterized protein n=2 Tax=Eucalyptus grandis TaxID=71139 RepID=A0ACC3JE02_EUCGR|nr:hypothetical protein EUGRSUZ_I00657 [Eucalyptus grandis]